MKALPAFEGSIRKRLGQFVAGGASRPLLLRYGVPLLLALGATALTAAVFDFETAPYFPILTLTVVIAAVWGGRNAGLVSTAACLLCILILVPHRVDNPQDIERISLFLVVGTAVSFLVGIIGEFQTRLDFERARLETTLSSIGDAVITTDADGNITLMNPVAEELTKWKLADAAGKPLPTVFRIINQETREAVENPVEKVRRSNLIVGLANHTLLVRPDGSEICIDDSGAPIRAADGALAGVVLVFRDVTEQRLSEQQLEERAQLLDLCNDAVLIRDSEDRITYWSRGAEELYGYSRAEALGKVSHDLLQTEFPKPLPELLASLKRNGLWTGRLEHTRQDGVRITTFSRWAVQTSPDQSLCTLESNRDITEEVRLQAFLDAEHERILKLERLAAAGQLASSLAHEINNPLEALTGLLYLLETYPGLDSTAREFATLASSEVARVSRIAKQSLSYYRRGTKPVEVDLTELTKQSLALFADRFGRTGIALQQKLRDTQPFIGFADEIRQAIDNLLLNAVEAMPRGGRLRVSVGQSRDWTQEGRKGVRLTVADTGAGIPKEARSQIFEPFFTTKAEKGTGLGLYVLSGIVGRHDGVIRVRSCVGPQKSGTVVSLFFPAQVGAPTFPPRDGNGQQSSYPGSARRTTE